MNNEWLKTYKFLDENCSKEASDIYYAMEFLKTSITDAGNAVSKIISNNSKDFNKIASLLPYGQCLNDVEKLIDDYLSDLNSCTINNDSEYNNTSSAHFLTEDFTGFSPRCFVFENKTYNVSFWKDALQKLCEILVDKDADYFFKVAFSNDFKGHKISYFSKSDNNSQYYHKLNNADIYIWTNRSTNALCSTMRDLLQKFNIPIEKFCIYLSDSDLDVKQLCFDSTEQNNHKDNIKIGEFVRNSMRLLSESKYKFSDTMLLKLTSGADTKLLFGIGLPFLKEISPKLGFSEQIKDSKGNNRYWKEIFHFNGKKFAIVSQWTKCNAERFRKWFDELPDKPE